MATTQNPYDRRARPRGIESSSHFAGQMAHTQSNGYGAYPGFGLDRLETIFRDEFARGWDAAEETHGRRLQDEVLPRARREAWAEGHADGVVDGRRAVTAELREEFDGDITVLRGFLTGALSDEKTTKATLRTGLVQAGALLEQMQDGRMRSVAERSA